MAYSMAVARYERQETREMRKRSREALKYIKMPRIFGVWSKEIINHPGLRRAGKWQKWGCVYGGKQQAKRRTL